MYFEEKGITATHAAFIKNICKELIQQDQLALNNISFIDSEIGLIGDSHQTRVSTGMKSLLPIKEQIEAITKVCSLSAWLGEAIKAKDEALNALNCMNKCSFAEEKNIPLPKTPILEDNITEEDIIKKMSKKERTAYLSCEARAAQIGKIIHPNGSFADARKKAMAVKDNPVVISGSGRDTTITNRSVSISLNEIDELFFDLQNEQRKAQGELNRIKSEIKKKVDAHNVALNEQYKADYAIYERELVKLEIQFKEYVIKERQFIASWKITIPEELQEIYSLIDSLGK